MPKDSSFYVLPSCSLFQETWAQVKSPFSGDFTKFRTELTTFMGPNLNDEQKNSLQSFLTKWDSTSYKQEDKHG